MTEDQMQIPETLPETLEALNNELLDTASQSAAQAFNVGCLLSALGIVTFVILATFLSHWVTGMIVLIITSMLAISLANLLAARSYQGNLKITFKRQIVPQLPDIQSRFGLTSEQLMQAARTALPEDAPLVQELADWSGAASFSKDSL